jgi:hypothetical protein
VTAGLGLRLVGYFLLKMIPLLIQYRLPQSDFPPPAPGLLEQRIETTFHGRLNPYWFGAVFGSHLPSFIHDDRVINDEVIDVAAAPTTFIARFDVQYVICRFQLVTRFDKQDVAIPGISTRAHW